MKRISTIIISLLCAAGAACSLSSCSSDSTTTSTVILSDDTSLTDESAETSSEENEETQPDSINEYYADLNSEFEKYGCTDDNYIWAQHLLIYNDKVYYYDYDGDDYENHYISTVADDGSFKKLFKFNENAMGIMFSSGYFYDQQNSDGIINITKYDTTGTVNAEKQITDFEMSAYTVFDDHLVMMDSNSGKYRLYSPDMDSYAEITDPDNKKTDMQINYYSYYNQKLFNWKSLKVIDFEKNEIRDIDTNGWEGGNFESNFSSFGKYLFSDICIYDMESEQIKHQFFESKEQKNINEFRLNYYGGDCSYLYENGVWKKIRYNSPAEYDVIKDLGKDSSMDDGALIVYKDNRYYAVVKDENVYIRTYENGDSDSIEVPYCPL